METLTRVTLDPDVMGGKACIRGLRVTVGTVLGLLAAGRSPDEILEAYPYLEREDIDEALAYAAWKDDHRRIPGMRVSDMARDYVRYEACGRPPLRNTR